MSRVTASQRHRVAPIARMALYSCLACPIAVGYAADFATIVLKEVALEEVIVKGQGSTDVAENFSCDAAPRVHINPGAELSSEEYALLNAGAPFQADPFLSNIELSASNPSERKTLYMIPGLRWQMNREIRVSVGVSVDLTGDPGGFTVLSAIARQF